MTAALAVSIAPQAEQSFASERVQVLEPRPGVHQVLLVTASRTQTMRDYHAVIVLGGGGGGFSMTSTDGALRVHGGLPLAQRQRLAKTIGGALVALSPPTDRPVMDRAWRMSGLHVADLQSTVDWTQSQWPHAQIWILGLNSGALSAAFATACIGELAGAVLLACAEEALDQPQKSERMRMLAVRRRRDSCLSYATLAHMRGRKTLVTVHDERQPWPDAAPREGETEFGGKEYQVVDVVARWILTGAAPDEIR